MLQVDHVDGKGYEERKIFTQQQIYRRVLAGEPGYQLLCANCNWKKKEQNNEVASNSKTPTVVTDYHQENV